MLHVVQVIAQAALEVPDHQLAGVSVVSQMICLMVGVALKGDFQLLKVVDILKCEHFSEQYHPFLICNGDKDGIYYVVEL